MLRSFETTNLFSWGAPTAQSSLLATAISRSMVQKFDVPLHIDRYWLGCQNKNCLVPEVRNAGAWFPYLWIIIDFSKFSVGCSEEGVTNGLLAFTRFLVTFALFWIVSKFQIPLHYTILPYPWIMDVSTCFIWAHTVYVKSYDSFSKRYASRCYDCVVKFTLKRSGIADTIQKAYVLSSR